MRYTLRCFFLSVAAVDAIALATAADSPVLKSWTLYHSLDGGKDFSKRGQILLSANDATVTDAALGLTIQQDDNEDLTSESIQQVIGTGFYQLKLVEDGNEANIVVTSVPACHLRRANFRDEIGLVLNPYGQAISLNYLPLQSPLAPSCKELAERSIAEATPIKFKSKISFETSTPAMVLKAILPTTKPPPGLKFFVKSGGLPGQPPEANDKPSSIFQRYWYVFLIFIMLQLIGVGSEPSAVPQGATGVAGSPQRVAASPNTAATAQRRGKRD